MTAPDAHGLLREQIADAVLGTSTARGCGIGTPGEIADAVLPIVEAAIAAAEMKFADEVHAQHREALAAAWAEGWHENYRVNFEGHITSGNPYRAAAPVPATPEEPPPAEPWIPCCEHCDTADIYHTDNGHDDTCRFGCNDDSGEAKT